MITIDYAGDEIEDSYMLRNIDRVVMRQCLNESIQKNAGLLAAISRNE